MTGYKLYRFSAVVANSHFQLNTLTFPITDTTEEEIFYKDKYIVKPDEAPHNTYISRDAILKVTKLTLDNDLSNYFIYCGEMDIELAIETLTSHLREIVLEKRRSIESQLFYLEDYINDHL